MEPNTRCLTPIYPEPEDTSLVDRFPYPSLLVSNDIPAGDEIEEIKTFLVEPTGQVQQMEAEMAALQARLDELRPRYAVLKKQVDTCRSPITILRRLPDDVLREVFFHCLPETRSPSMDSTSAPTMLTTVCRRWRTLAIQTPTFWSSIHIPIEDVKRKRSMTSKQIDALREDSQQRLCTMLSMWLARSKNCPLTFTLCLSVYDTQFNHRISTAYKNCLEILLPSISRWKNVYFEGRIEWLYSLLKMPTPLFRSLESLCLNPLGDPLPNSLPFFHSSSLRKVSVQHQHINLINLSLPWPKLTHLDLAGATSTLNTPRLSTILKESTSLVYLGLDISKGEDFTPIDLPNLQRISIRQHTASRDSDLPRSLSENLRAPLLRHISLRNFDDTSFPAILSRHGQSITSLDFNTQYIEFETFAESISQCPSLESLFITRIQGDSNHFRINRKFFSLFTPNDMNPRPQGPLCPSLRDFMFDNIACETLKGLVSFLQSRQKTSCLGPSRPIKISTAFVREGDQGDRLSEETVQDALKPFTEDNTLFKLRIDPIARYYGMRQDQYFGVGHFFQYADGWRD